MSKFSQLPKYAKVLIIAVIALLLFVTIAAATVLTLQTVGSNGNSAVAEPQKSLEDQANAKLSAGDKEGALVLFEQALAEATAQDPAGEKVLVLSSKIDYVKYDIANSPAEPKQETSAEQYDAQTIDGGTEVRATMQ